MPPQENLADCPTKNENESLKMKGIANPAFVSDSCGQNEKEKELQTEKEAFEFDDLLPHIGEFGIYQKILFLLMIPFSFFVAWVYFAQIFITIVPEKHWCRVPELANLTVEER